MEHLAERKGRRETQKIRQRDCQPNIQHELAILGLLAVRAIRGKLKNVNFGCKAVIWVKIW